MIFFKRKNENRGVVVPSVVDAEMCEYFGVEADKKAWYNDWYNRFLVDFMLGKDPVGNDLEELKILNWLGEHFEIVK